MKRSLAFLLSLLAAAAGCDNNPGFVVSVPAGAGGESAAGASGAGQGGAGQAGSSGSGPGAGQAGAGQAGSAGGSAGGQGGQGGGSAGSGGAGGSAGSAGQAGAAGQGGAGGAGSGGAGASGSSGQGGAACALPADLGVAVAVVDQYSYPPYAADGCSVAYLAPAGQGQELRLRALDTGDDLLLAPASEAPRRPALAGSLVAWEAVEGGKPVVRVRHEGETSTVTGAFHHAGEPRAAAGVVVFTGWLTDADTGDTDVFLYDAASKSTKVAAGGPKQQRFADVSDKHVAYTDFTEDTQGAFNNDGSDLADVVLVDRTSGAVTPHKRSGKQAFPLLGSAGSVVFLDWDGAHPEPKLQAYGVRAWTIGSADDVALFDVLSAQQEVRPSARDGVVVWVTSQPDFTQKLYKTVIAEGGKSVVQGLDGLSLFAPVLGQGYVAIGVQKSGSASASLKLIAQP